MYDGDDRTKQIDAIFQLAEDIFQALPCPETTVNDITPGNLHEGGYLPDDWPSWFTPHDLGLLLAKLKGKFTA